jgi:hypothetical protein
VRRSRRRGATRSEWKAATKLPESTIYHVTAWLVREGYENGSRYADASGESRRTRLASKNSSNRIADRLAWLQGKRVTVRVSYADSGQLSAEEFVGIYRDVVPMGREYFFVFEWNNTERLIRTSSVVEIVAMGD